MTAEIEKTLYQAAERQTAINEKLTKDITLTLQQITASIDLNDQYRDWLNNEGAEIAARLARQIEENIQSAFLDMLAGISTFADKMKEASTLTRNDLERQLTLFEPQRPGGVMHRKRGPGGVWQSDKSYRV